MVRTWISVAAAAAMMGLVSPANAVVEFDQDVTTNVIMGTGIGNGGFTTDRRNGIELGIRGKLRFDDTNQPQDIFNSNGDGTYSFDAGKPVGGGFGFALGSSSTAVWNFDWSINSNFDGNGANLNQFNYRIGMDFDPGVGTNFLTFDPINVGAGNSADHSFGNNGTLQGQGAEIDKTASDVDKAAEYALLIANNNLGQNSWNMEFFDDGGSFFFDAAVDGTYTFFLEAFAPGTSTITTTNSANDPLARVEIQIIVGAGATVPEPATLSLFAAGLLGLGFAGYRRRRQTS